MNPLGGDYEACIDYPIVTSQQIQTIATTLKNKNNLVEKLKLPSNDIGGEEAKVFSKMLMHENSKIHELNLWYNNVGDNGAQAIANALMHKNNRVNLLHLDSNGVGCEGTKALAEAMVHENNKLITLTIYDCVIEAAGENAIAKTLFHPNCAIEWLGSHIEGERVKRAVKHRRTCKNLFVVLSARQVQRIGACAAIRHLPSDLIRLVAQILEH